MIKILIADDQELIRQSLLIILDNMPDFHVTDTAADGQEVIRCVKREKPDVILMDIRMPDMNGLDATRIIKEVNHDIPIVALSAYAFDENIREAKAAGCDDFMAKPFRVEDLLDMVEKYINK